MHQREVIAAGQGTLTDSLHLVWVYIHLFFLLVAMGLAASALNRSFRLYSIFTLILFLVFGALTSMEAPGVERNEPTLDLGAWERINMLAYVMWIGVLGIVFAKRID